MSSLRSASGPPRLRAYYIRILYYIIAVQWYNYYIVARFRSYRRTQRRLFFVLRRRVVGLLQVPVLLYGVIDLSGCGIIFYVHFRAFIRLELFFNYVQSKDVFPRKKIKFIIGFCADYITENQCNHSEMDHPVCCSLSTHNNYIIYYTYLGNGRLYIIITQSCAGSCDFGTHILILCYVGANI